ncbi:substrate-binding periplasmic protein [Spartinivicinus poritis]|uniref:Transporter substrate-binding domain-containing protein n=1 Tax=Spartinivicinus poritis TaxID=2994640 RepID=A0ABT5UC55_9GAMM|nr:transporter substrate-binding domain-containing protein [Spartinivicinus sp. A2-2]MDE1463969.1 transporter substrate-binding domain-containing protein [Spartinivicinus sp. A2-2]
MSKRSHVVYSYLKYVACFYCGLLVCQLASAVERITIAVGEWPPYISDKMKYQGVVGRVIRDAFAIEGVQVQYRFYPWSRALEMTKKGAFHGSAPWYITEDRKQHFLYSNDFVCRITAVFFHLKSVDFDWKNYKELGRSYKIGATIGYLYSEEFQQMVKNKVINVEWVATDELNFKKLLKHRIDIFPNDAIAGYAQLYKFFPEQEAALVTNHPRTLKDDPAYLMISKGFPNSTQLKERFDRGLSKLKRSGQFDEYFNELLEGKYVEIGEDD